MNPCRSRFAFRLDRLIPALLVALVAGCGGGQDPLLGAPGVGIAPTVIATSPLATDPAVTGVASDSTVRAVFSQPMDADTLTPESFSLACPAGTPVEAGVEYDADTRQATLTPDEALPPDTVCTATVTTVAQDTEGHALAADFKWSFRTAPADPAPPIVTLVLPADGAVEVALNTSPRATFSKAMDADTLTPASFRLACPAGTPVEASIGYAAATRQATLTPAAALPANTLCVATLTTAAQDSGGVALAEDFAWSFRTGAFADLTRPAVTLTVPADGAVDVATNTRISATFSEDMDARTLSGSTFTVEDTTLNTAVAGSVSYSAAARTATFTPTAALAANSSFTATIAAAATDLAGNALAADHAWDFDTAATGDNAAPTVLSVSPVPDATGVCRTTVVSAIFSEPMDPATIGTGTFVVTGGGTVVEGRVSYDAATRVASFTPSAPGFAAGTAFTVVIRSGADGVKDLAGNALASDETWEFTTGTNPCTPPIVLGSAALFGAFGGDAGVTNQGINTVVNGNLSTAGVCTLVTGFHDAVNVYTQTPLNVGLVNGSVFCAPPTPGTLETAAIANKARADALAAYVALAALPPGDDPGAGQLGGLVLPPAVYTSAGGTFAITSGNLTLDAAGDPDAVWVFQSAASFTIGLPALPRRVLLVNGAQAKNVYWQVGSAARIEDGSTMVGTIIAPAGVTISTAGQTVQTTLIGRALGLTASVTMVNTTIVLP